MKVEIIPVHGIPEVERGQDIAELILAYTRVNGINIEDNDVIVVKQKIVSKSEGMLVRLEDVKPSRRALSIAHKNKKDPRLVELILRESRRILRAEKGIIIAETKHGFVCANAGIDKSNVPSGYVSLLPRDPDRSARRIRRKIESNTGKRIAVIISDTFGRPWRKGQVDVAIGCSGIEPLISFKGKKDKFGYKLRVTQPAVVDEIASAAELVSGKLSSVPVVVVRGISYRRSNKGVRTMKIPEEMDLFR